MEQDGQTPLHMASYHGHVDVVKELLARGACACHKDKVRVCLRLCVCVTKLQMRTSRKRALVFKWLCH
eukprot:scaffold186801_cov17-Tisochrysis_lutea.AAC.2